MVGLKRLVRYMYLFKQFNYTKCILICQLCNSRLVSTGFTGKAEFFFARDSILNGAETGFGGKIK
jgi:hypothetical protein